MIFKVNYYKDDEFKGIFNFKVEVECRQGHSIMIRGKPMYTLPPIQTYNYSLVEHSVSNILEESVEEVFKKSQNYLRSSNYKHQLRFENFYLKVFLTNAFIKSVEECDDYIEYSFCYDFDLYNFDKNGFDKYLKRIDRKRKIERIRNG